MKAPVERCVYVNSPLSRPHLLKSGLLALSDISLVGANEHDGAIAIYKNSFIIPKDNIITEREFEDFFLGGEVIEVWSYDPALFATENRVDDISLLMSLANNSNERVQIGLDAIRKKHEIPIKYDERGGILMVNGIDIFKKHFSDFKNQYTVIGGFACW